MKERPILFSVAMVQAILAGNKTQTRRIMQMQPLWQPDFYPSKGWVTAGDMVVTTYVCPYGNPGDQLWVREEHYRFGHWEEVPGLRTKKGRQKWKFVADIGAV